MATPILGMDEMTQSQASKYVTFNSAINTLDTAAGLYALGLTYDGSPGTGEVILRHPAPIAFNLPISLTNSQFYAATAANATATFTLKKNGASIGTIQFATGATSGTATFSTGVAFAVSDKLTMEAPSPADSTLADLGFSIKGTK
jgi:hypothetical protein